MPDNLNDLIEDAAIAFHGEDHDAFRAAAARLAMPLIAERDKLAAELSEARRQLAYIWQVTGSCPCGARAESPNTHPHVNGCPTSKATKATQ